MKQNNYSFVDFISGLFLLIILITNFLGLLYITEGNMVLSFLISMVIIIFYFYVVKYLRSNKEAMWKNKFLDKSAILWVFFLFLATTTFGLTTHFLNVEYNSKTAIQNDALEKIGVVKKAFSSYKQMASTDLNDYEGNLKNDLRNFKKSGDQNIKQKLLAPPYSLPLSVFQNPFINEDRVTRAAVNPLRQTTDQNILKMEKKILIDEKYYSSVFKDWKRLKLMDTYHDLDIYVSTSLDSINANIYKLPFQNRPLDIATNQTELPINDPVKLYDKFKPSLLIPSVMVLFTHGFILIPFFTERVRNYSSSGYTDDNVREI